MHDIRYGFISPGHRAIMGIPVLHVFLHSSGACLSIHSIGRSMALCWRASDSWKATVSLVFEIDNCPTREENYDAAFRVGLFLLDQGPPEALLASAIRSGEVRKEKARNASNQRWKNHSDSKVNAAAKPKGELANITTGPDVDPSKWQWTNVTYEEMGQGASWMLSMQESEEDHLFCEWVAENRWKLGRNWRAEGETKHTQEIVLETAALEECFAIMKSMAKRGCKLWKKGEKH